MLRLVELENVTELPVYNFQDLAACARRFADQVEEGIQGEPFRVALVIQTDEGLAISVWGESADGHQLMGLFEAAKLTVFAEGLAED